MSGRVEGVRRPRRLLTAVLLAIAGLLAAVPFALTESKAGQPQPKPDFTVLSVRIQSDSRPYHMFEDRTNDGLIFVVRVKNVGDMPRAGAGKLVFRGDGLLRPIRQTFDVPRLRPGHQVTIVGEVSHRDLGGITTYSTNACASTRKDPNHRNDCHRGPGFAVIPRTWVGTTNATTNPDGVVIQSVGANTTFTYDEAKSEAQRQFYYVGTGPVTLTITGDHDPDCTYSGTGTLPAAPAQTFLYLDTDLLHYRAQGVIDMSTYQAQVSCFGGGVGSYSQTPGIWLATPITAKEAFDEVLTGSQDDNGGDVWNWNIHAE